MINEKEGMIVYERTKFPKLAKPLLIDRLIVILEKYRNNGTEYRKQADEGMRKENVIS